jgi:hypothetical protein
LVESSPVSDIEADGQAKENCMAASAKRIICKALPEIIQSKDATTGERLSARVLVGKSLSWCLAGALRFPRL